MHEIIPLTIQDVRSAYPVLNRGEITEIQEPAGESEIETTLTVAYTDPEGSKLFILSGPHNIFHAKQIELEKGITIISNPQFVSDTQYKQAEISKKRRAKGNPLPHSGDILIAPAASSNHDHIS